MVRGTPKMSAISWTVCSPVSASVVELLGEGGLLGCELAAGAGCLQAVVGVGHDQLTLEFGEYFVCRHWWGC